MDLALILAVIYRFALKKSAEYRNATGELNDLLTNAVFCVVLTVFSHDNYSCPCCGHKWSDDDCTVTETEETIR